jgi:hypothetical protein
MDYLFGGEIALEKFVKLLQIFSTVDVWALGGKWCIVDAW